MCGWHLQGEVHVAYASRCINLFGGSSVEYSGGMSLAAATARTCHVACQLQPCIPGSPTQGMLQSQVTAAAHSLHSRYHVALFVCTGIVSFGGVHDIWKTLLERHLSVSLYSNTVCSSSYFVSICWLSNELENALKKKASLLAPARQVQHDGTMLASL